AMPVTLDGRPRSARDLVMPMEPMASTRERMLGALLLVNLWLQIFDGVATYLGVTAGYGEGNPIVAATFTHIGMGPALVVAKLYACGCLVLIWHLRGRS